MKVFLQIQAVSCPAEAETWAEASGGEKEVSRMAIAVDEISCIREIPLGEDHFDWRPLVDIVMSSGVVGKVRVHSNDPPEVQGKP